MLRITLDTNTLLYVYDDDHTSPVERDEIIELLERDDVDAAITAVVDRDLNRDPDPERRDRLRRAIGRHHVIEGGPGPFRFDVSYFDGPDGLVSDEDSRQLDALKLVLWPEGVDTEHHAKAHRQVTDVDHLHLHRKAGRDAFVTLDTKVLAASDTLEEGFGIRVVRPSELLAELREQESGQDS